MRYIQPTITGSFDALSTIKGVKSAPQFETEILLSSVAAYPADE
jgi:hypothetical protein